MHRLPPLVVGSRCAGRVPTWLRSLRSLRCPLRWYRRRSLRRCVRCSCRSYRYPSARSRPHQNGSEPRTRCRLPRRLDFEITPFFMQTLINTRTYRVDWILISHIFFNKIRKKYCFNGYYKRKRRK